jgi:hypothetical protein
MTPKRPLQSQRKDLDRLPRPTPATALAETMGRLQERFGARSDRFSQLLGKMASHQVFGSTVVGRNALTEEEAAELRGLADGAYTDFVREAKEAIKALRGLLGKGDPLYTLGWLCMTNLMAPWGGYFEPTHRGRESNIELAAGLLLTQPPNTERNLSDRDLQAVHDSLERLSLLTLLRNMTKPDTGETADIRFISTMNWMMLRGTSYAEHGADLAREVYRPYSQWALENYGFTVDDALAVANAVQALVSERISRARRGIPEAMERFAGKKMTLTDSLQGAAAVRKFFRDLGEAPAFTVEDLAERGLPTDRVKAVLAELSADPGSLPPGTYTSLFDKSPLVRTPFVGLGGRYILPIPGGVLRDGVALLEDRFVGKLKKFTDSRAKTLDRLAVQYLLVALPGGRGFTNLFYESGELDGLVLFDRVALVVEGKGFGLSPQARRGDMARLRGDLAEAVEEAWEQGARARDYLRVEGDSVFVNADGSEVLRIPRGSIDTIFIVNPTLYELGGHATQLPALRALGLFEEGEYPWSVFVNDLRVISETSSNPAVFLHYFTWRARLPLGDRLIAMDEIDIWSSYLLGERFGNLADDGMMQVGTSTTDFDDYYAGLAGTGPKTAKPEKLLPPTCAKRFVEKMARDRPRGWLSASGVLLDLSLPELAALDIKGQQLCKRANVTRSVCTLTCGRFRLLALPRGGKLRNAASEGRTPTEATFNIYLRGTAGKHMEILWAETLKPVTFELSAFEKEILEASGFKQPEEGGGS